MSTDRLSGLDKEVFDKIEAELPGVEFIDFFKTGSTARVYHVRLPIGLDVKLKVDRIIKVFRDSIEQSSQLDTTELFLNEVQKLISVSHNNVISVYSAGYLRVSETAKLPYYTMEFVPGAVDSDRWLRRNARRLSRETIIQLLLQAARGIEALHMKNIIHCDLKFGNLLIGEAKQVKIADLGFAKYLAAKAEKIGLYTNHHYLPQCYKDYLVRMVDIRQAYVELPSEYVAETLDLHYFGRLMLEVVQDPVVKPLLSDSDQRSFQLITDRLDLDNRTASLPRYEEIGPLILDLEKMQGLYLNRAGVEELSSYTGTRTIRIPVSGSSPFTVRVAEVAHHPVFFRLNNVQQLGLTHYVFPGAVHTRLEHSIGVFSNVSNYINSLLADDYQPYFRQLVDQEMIVTALLAGLLHDIGQHSFSHSLEDVRLSPRHERVAETFITGKGMDEYVDYDSDIPPLKEIIRRHWPEVRIDRLCWLINRDRRRPEGTESIGWEIVRAILSGPIDADKTDYLIRDAHHAGVEYARSIDITRFMNSLTAALVKKGDYAEGVLAITWKGKQSAENILLARSQMFWVLYWHHAVRCAHAMVADACFSHLKTLSDSDLRSFNRALYWGTPGEFISYLGQSESPRARQLASWISVRRLFKRIIELNYEDNEDLYESLLDKKTKCDQSGDMCLSEISGSIAEQLNRLFKQSLPRRLTQSDVIVDIPKAGKDKLGRIYVVEKGSETAVPYESKGMIGSRDDWQNRVRTIRIFVDPDIDEGCRKMAGLKANEILRCVCST